MKDQVTYNYSLSSIIDTTHYSIQCDHLHQPMKAIIWCVSINVDVALQFIRVKFPQK